MKKPSKKPLLVTRLTVKIHNFQRDFQKGNLKNYKCAEFCDYQVIINEMLAKKPLKKPSESLTSCSKAGSRDTAFATKHDWKRNPENYKCTQLCGNQVISNKMVTKKPTQHQAILTRKLLISTRNLNQEKISVRVKVSIRVRLRVTGQMALVFIIPSVMSKLRKCIWCWVLKSS